MEDEGGGELNVGGIVVPVGDDVALSSAIVELAERRDMCDKMGTRNRRYVLDHYRWEKSAELLLGVYETAVLDYRPKRLKTLDHRLKKSPKTLDHRLKKLKL